MRAGETGCFLEEAPLEGEERGDADLPRNRYGATRSDVISLELATKSDVYSRYGWR